MVFNLLFSTVCWPCNLVRSKTCRSAPHDPRG